MNKRWVVNFGAGAQREIFRHYEAHIFCSFESAVPVSVNLNNCVSFQKIG